MLKKTITAVLMTISVLSSHAIIWHYGNLNETKKQCRVTGWSGTQPTSGKLTIPSTYTHTDGITYTVVTVTDHALDGLTEVTEIKIPSTIKRIGQSGYGYTEFEAVANNFFNCPKLTKFTVDTSNEYFTTTSEGILCLKERGGMLLRVPAKVELTGGKLTVGSSYSRICPDAFAENTSVKTLSLDKSIIITNNGGLNQAKNIATYEVTGSGSLIVADGALVKDIADISEVVSFPVASTRKKCTLSTNVSDINTRAFANCRNLEEVVMPVVQSISKYAFAGSGIKQLTIPASASHIEKSICEGCPRLETLTFDGNYGEYGIPENFARSCPQLTRVIAGNPPRRIEKAAFLECHKLEEFPLSASTILGDSVFYNCGFRQVVFDNEDYCGYTIGRAVFALNNSLERIDMSQVGGTDYNGFRISDGFAATCPELKTVEFAPFTEIWAGGDNYIPAFGYSCVLEKIVIHNLGQSGTKPQMVYTSRPGQSDYSPAVYVAATALSDISANWNSWGIRYLFGTEPGATVSPRFIVDVLDPETNADNVSIGTFFVPGGASRYYGNVSDAQNRVHEFYNISMSQSQGKLRVSIDQNNRPTQVPALSQISVSFDGDEPAVIGAGGYAYSETSYSNVNKIRMSYVIDGVSMCTDYPSSFWHQSGIGSDDICNDNDVDAVYYDINGRRVANPTDSGIYIVRHSDGTTGTILIK